MSNSTVAQLQALLAQLQALDIQEPNPQLDLQLVAVATMAQTEIQQHQHVVNQTVAPSPAAGNDPGTLLTASKVYVTISNPLIIKYGP
jgi:hypothetical protein